MVNYGYPVDLEKNAELSKSGRITLTHHLEDAFLRREGLGKASPIFTNGKVKILSQDEAMKMLQVGHKANEDPNVVCMPMWDEATNLFCTGSTMQVS